MMKAAPWRLLLVGISVAAVLIVTQKATPIVSDIESSTITSSQGHRSLLRHSSSSSPLFTPKLSASSSPNVLNIHLVPHTHDDVGWLKTVEQYFYGWNNSNIQHAHVHAILETTLLDALPRNPNRTFTYVEQKFFSMWWSLLSSEERAIVRDQIHSTHQLSFVNGGWCMHDEAATHYMGMIDQTTLGHSFLSRQLNVTPTVGWQLDPFGHSATQASLLTHSLGFDALYFGRIDYQDLQLRHERQQCEGLWDTGSSSAPILWGLTGSYGGNYGPPPGFCFDVGCDFEPIVGLPEEQLLARVHDFLKEVRVQFNRTQGNHIMITAGSDFQYSNAEVNFMNHDLLMDSIWKFQASGKINASSLFAGTNIAELNIFYSNPTYYTEQKYSEQQNNPAVDWETKTDDFFPYADGPHAYWTGYFTSRTAFKRLERVASSFLMAARQIQCMEADFETTTTMSTTNENEASYRDEELCDCQNKPLLSGCTCMRPLYDLEDALGVVQHHDAVSGTAKQHVANDYSKRVQAGVNRAVEFVVKRLKQLIFLKEDVDKYLTDLMYCQLLNETKCEVTENGTANGDEIYIFVFNALAQERSAIIPFPVSRPGLYQVNRVETQRGREGKGTTSQLVRAIPVHGQVDKYVVYGATGLLPPTGGFVFKFSLHDANDGDDKEVKTKATTTAIDRQLGQNKNVVSNGVLEVEFNGGTSFVVRNLENGLESQIEQQWGYYKSYDSSIDKPAGQNSGAYIFRPSEPDEEMTILTGKEGPTHEVQDMVTEVHFDFDVPWMKQVARVYQDQPYVEVEYTVGPIPIDDGIGKEIVTRYMALVQNNGVFYTDSNGREFQKRTRSSRPTWKLDENEPVAGNYYPVNAGIYIEDEDLSLVVLTDRSQGGSSLKDGAVELMVQRRTLQDDRRGVFEPMNETVGGMTPYPPYGDATRIGPGVVVTGKHRLFVGKGNVGAATARAYMDAAFSDPLVFAASAPAGTDVPFEESAFQLISSALPANVMLMTFARMIDEPATTYLIRVGHQYATGEDPELSRDATVCLGKIVGKKKIVSIKEKTLSGNQDIGVWHKRRLNWRSRSARAEEFEPVDCIQDSCMVLLKPMQIRTFFVQVEKH